MVWFRWHAVETVEYEYFTPLLGCVRRKGWNIYKHVYVPLCGVEAKETADISDCLANH